MNPILKYSIRGLLLVLICFLAYQVYEAIAGPVRYKKEVVKNEAIIIERLELLKTAQMAYKDVHGQFTGSFDTLIDFMENGQLEVVISHGSLDDSTSNFYQETKNVGVKDSLFADIDIPNVRYVPFLENVEFIMNAGHTEKSGVMLPTFEIKDPQPFSKDRRREGNPLKVGDLSAANYNGNWR